jgi:predicted N-acetyltransferase YhbS
MLIERIPEFHLTVADDAEIAGLLARCFDTDFGGRSYFTHRHHLRLVARQGQIIGHMALMLRAVDLGGRQTTIVGVAEVATDPAHRGEGIAAALLQAAIVEAKASPAEFMLLFGTAKLYAAAGFYYISNQMAVTSVDAERSLAKAQHLMVLPLKSSTWPEDATLDLRGPEF